MREGVVKPGPLSMQPMPSLPRSTPRLFVEAPLVAGEAVPLAREQVHYLMTVMRLGDGAAVKAFNGRDGEWLCRLEPSTRKDAALRPESLLRPQPPACDLHYLFAPLKSARLDYLAQKAVEMGASVLQPVITRRTQVSRLNLDRLKANAIEAAEQCGILALPDIRPERPLDRLLAEREPGRRLIVCDEEAPVANPVAALRDLTRGPLAILIGPEGGFDDQERALFLRQPAVTLLSLGPRILRADTAAVAAFAIVQSTLGDWG
jgi:16S rRNA (uracil1498-N3)-methyltransferase